MTYLIVAIGLTITIAASVCLGWFLCKLQDYYVPAADTPEFTDADLDRAIAEVEAEDRDDERDDEHDMAPVTVPVPIAGYRVGQECWCRCRLGRDGGCGE